MLNSICKNLIVTLKMHVLVVYIYYNAILALVKLKKQKPTSLV